MSKEAVSVNFYGHDKPAFSGLKANAAPFGSIAKGAWQMYRRGDPLFVEGLNVVGEDRLVGKYSHAERGPADAYMKIKLDDKNIWIYDYNAGLNRDSNIKLAKDLLDSISSDMGGLTKDALFMVTGSSAGGVSALYFGRLLSERKLKVYYLGLGDPEFYKGESDDMRTGHKVEGDGTFYFKNYYQTKDNPDPWPDAPAVQRTIGFHDTVNGFTNISLNSELPPNLTSNHFKACQIANNKMFDDLVWCIDHC